MTAPAPSGGDDTAALQAYIDSLPNGASASPTVCTFPANVAYQLDGQLNLVKRVNLTFVGTNVSFNRVNETGLRSNFHWSTVGCTNIVWRGLTMTGLNTAGHYVADLEAQHAFNIAGTTGFEIDDCTVEHIFGDYVYLTNYPSDRVASHGHIHNSTFNRNGRQGVSFIGCHDIEIDHNQLKSVARTVFDFEVHGLGQPVDQINIHDNDIAIHGLNFISSGANPMLAPATNITINNNRARNFCQIYFKGGTTPATRAANFTFTNNVADGPAWGTGGNPACLALENVDGATVTGNRQPLQIRYPAMRMVQAHNCTNVIENANDISPHTLTAT